MIRKLSVLGGLLLLVLGTVTILWAGLNWPPPLWVLEYGPPPSQKPTGRVFHVEGVDFVEISSGYFRMGSDYLAQKHENGATTGNILGRVSAGLGLSCGTAPKPSDEMPVHWVRFEHPFAIAKTEVTNAQYERFDPSHKRIQDSPADQDPVENLDWMQAHTYCDWLSQESGWTIRLPHEQEWEATCRAGSTSEYVCGRDAGQLPEHAPNRENASGRAHCAATRKANAWGLFGMDRRPSEWCEDVWQPSYDLTCARASDASTTTFLPLPRGHGAPWVGHPSAVRVYRAMVNGYGGYGAPWVGHPSDVRVIRGFRTPKGCRPARRDGFYEGFMRFGVRPTIVLPPAR